MDPRLGEMDSKAGARMCTLVLLKVASSMGSVATSLGGVDSKEAMVTGVDSE